MQNANKHLPLVTARGHCPSCKLFDPLSIHPHLMLHRITIHYFSQRVLIDRHSLNDIFPADLRPEYNQATSRR